jgi:hypothetical protein
MVTPETPEALWWLADSWIPKGRRVVLFTYDLAEQLRVSHMLTVLAQRGWSIDAIVMDKAATWCLLRNGTRSLMCCDLRGWCPVEFGRLQDDVRHTVNTSKVIEAGPSYPATLALMRATVIREAALQIFNWIEGENLGQFRPTGSGQSFTAYRRRFATTRLLVHDDVSRLAAERVSMYTGRAEAWRHGLLRNGPFVEYDLHAAYATIGANHTVPTVARQELDRPQQHRLERLCDRYSILADVTVTTDVECVPTSVGGRTIWPVGTFRSWLWDPELRLAWEHCDTVECHRAYLYQRDHAVRDFCLYVLSGMGDQQQAYGMVPKRVLKHWSRCLIGRFGLRYRGWHKFGDQDPPDVRLVTFTDLEDGVRTDMMLAGSQRLVLGDMQESPESLPQIPAWIMSQCRADLWSAMRSVGLGKVAYIDTDSIIVINPVGDSVRSWGDTMLGRQWAHKGTYNRMRIHGPRNLEIDNARRVSGLPLSAQQTRPLQFTGEVMRSVRHSMQTGQMDMVVSMPRDFHFTQADLRRVHNPDGSTSPYRLEISDKTELD